MNYNELLAQQILRDTLSVVPESILELAAENGGKINITAIYGSGFEDGLLLAYLKPDMVEPMIKSVREFLGKSDESIKEDVELFEGAFAESEANLLRHHD